MRLDAVFAEAELVSGLCPMLSEVHQHAVQMILPCHAVAIREEA